MILYIIHRPTDVRNGNTCSTVGRVNARPVPVSLIMPSLGGFFLWFYFGKTLIESFEQLLLKYIHHSFFPFYFYFFFLFVTYVFGGFFHYFTTTTPCGHEMHSFRMSNKVRVCFKIYFQYYHKLYKPKYYTSAVPRCNIFYRIRVHGLNACLIPI